MKSRIIILLMLFGSALLASEPAPAPAYPYHTLSYNMNIDIYNCFTFPYSNEFTASLTITLKADSAIRYVTLNAIDSSLLIDSVGLAGISFTHSNNLLTVNLYHTYQPGDTALISSLHRHKPY